MNVEERGTTVAVALAAMRLPLIVAPMTAVSGPELVKASVRAGVMGSFPTGNCTSVGELDDWLSEIAAVGKQCKCGIQASIADRNAG